MTEKICTFAKEYTEIPRLTLGLSLAADSLQAANRLLWQRGIALKFELVTPSDYDKNQIISCQLVDCLTGPKLYQESRDAQAERLEDNEVAS